MIKRIIGLLGAAATIAVLICTILGAGGYRSFFEPPADGGNPTHPACTDAPEPPATHTEDSRRPPESAGTGSLPATDTLSTAAAPSSAR